MAGRAGPQAGQHLFTPVTHPELRQLGQKNIHVFLKERELYLLRLQDANAASSADMSPITLKASIDADLLQSLIDFDEFGESVTSLETLTDEALKAWLEGKLEKSLDTLTLCDLEAAVKAHVRINVHEPNAEIRIMRLFTDYRTLLRIKKWESLVQQNTKIAVQHIVDLLKPLALKTRVENDLDLGKRDLRKNWKDFYKYVREEAIHCEKYVPIKASSGKSETEKPSGSRDQQSKGQMGTQHSSVMKSTNTSTKQGQAKAAALPGIPSASQFHIPTSSPTRELPDCLNKTCKGKHLIRNCPKTPSKEEQDRLLKEWRESKKRVAALLMDSYGAAQTGSGRYSATLADKVPVVVNGDYGADHSALSSSHLKSCADAGIFIPILPLPEPVQVELALGGKDEQDITIFSSCRKARISTTVLTSKGPMRLRNVEYLVFDEQMPEVLLSRPLLQSMGFNLDEHFAAVRETFHDADFSHVGFAPDPSLAQVQAVPQLPGRVAQLMLSQRANASPILPMDEAHDPDASPDDEGTYELDLTMDKIDEAQSIPSRLFYGDVTDYDPIPSDDEVLPRDEDDVAT